MLSRERGEASGADLDEIGLARAARQRLEPERTRAGEEVEHARAGQVGLHDAHPRFAHAIARSGERARPRAASIAARATCRRRCAPIAVTRRYDAEVSEPRLQPRLAVLLVALEPERDVDHRSDGRAPARDGAIPQPSAVSSVPFCCSRSLRPSLPDDRGGGRDA